MATPAIKAAPAPEPSFKVLVDKVRDRGEDRKPVPYGRIAKRCRISRQYLYDLMKGRKQASPLVEKRIAAAFDVDPAVVHASIWVSLFVGRQ